MNGDAIDLTSPACTYLYLLRDGSENGDVAVGRGSVGQFFLCFSSKFDRMFLFIFSSSKESEDFVFQVFLKLSKLRLRLRDIEAKFLEILLERKSWNMVEFR